MIAPAHTFSSLSPVVINKYWQKREILNTGRGSDFYQSQILNVRISNGCKTAVISSVSAAPQSCSSRLQHYCIGRVVPVSSGERIVMERI